jgi:hypothetical protein
MEPWNPETIVDLGQVNKKLNVELIPVFDIQENQFSRYEQLVNHLRMSFLDPSKINNFFTFKKNATPIIFFCLYHQITHNGSGAG